MADKFLVTEGGVRMVKEGSTEMSLTIPEACQVANQLAQYAKDQPSLAARAREVGLAEAIIERLDLAKKLVEQGHAMQEAHPKKRTPSAIEEQTRRAWEKTNVGKGNGA